MSDPLEPLVSDLVAWVGKRRRYTEVMDAWKTSCPRLPVWEDAKDRGFITRQHLPGSGALVSVSAAGAEHLRTNRQLSPR